MKTEYVSLCSWDFEFGDEIYFAEELIAMAPPKRESIVNARLAFLMKALGIFKKHKMLVVERIKVYIFGKELNFDVSNSGYEVLFEKLHKDLQQVPKDTKSFFFVIAKD